MLNNFSNLNLDDFNYELPKNRIAEYPLENRDMSKLLYFNALNDSIEHHTFKDITQLIPDNSLLILNSTKVIAARLLMQKVTGGVVELLLIEPIEPSTNPSIALQSRSSCRWKCLFGGKNVNLSTTLHLFKSNISEDILYSSIHKDKIKLFATFQSIVKNEAIVEFDWRPSELTFASIIEIAGKIPLPPYIKRDTTSIDKNRYQTEYAKNEGSIAAPTAGLHWTQEILDSITSNGTEITELTLHVGPGTFVPISTNNIAEHVMHNERIFFPIEAIESIYNHLQNENNSKIIATGTTSMRAVESLYWFGVKLLLNKNDIIYNSIFSIKQFDPYELSEKNTLPEPKKSLDAIINYMNKNDIRLLEAETQLFIVPGYQFRIINGLITNYHLPKSTLILLVASFIGEKNWRRIYQAALNNEYRFLSYGDTSFLLK